MDRSGERGSNPRPQLWESCALVQFPPDRSSFDLKSGPGVETGGQDCRYKWSKSGLRTQLLTRHKCVIGSMRLVPGSLGATPGTRLGDGGGPLTRCSEQVASSSRNWLPWGDTPRCCCRCHTLTRGWAELAPAHLAVWHETSLTHLWVANPRAPEVRA